jgi:hypothetical protein
MSRLFVTGDGSWGVIQEDEFAIMPCDFFTGEDWETLDYAADRDKIHVATITMLNKILERGVEGGFAVWQDIPDLLLELSNLITELSFSEDSIAQVVQPRLRSVSLRLREGLGF